MNNLKKTYQRLEMHLHLKPVVVVVMFEVADMVWSALS